MSSSKYNNKPSPATQKLIIIIFGAFLICMSMYFFLVKGKNIVLECSRINPTNSVCTITEANLISKSIKTISIADITGSRIESKKVKSKGRIFTESQLVLITRTGEVPLSSVFSRNLQLIQNNLAKMNVFLTYTTQTSIIIVDDERAKPFTVGAIMFILGIIIIIASLFIKSLIH